MAGADVLRCSRVCRSVVALVAVAAMLVMGGSAFGTSETGLRRVRAVLLLTHPEHWQTEGSSGCIGSGFYADVGPKTQVVVRSENGSVLARTTLGRGTSANEGCTWAFKVSLPSAATYTFKIGKAGSVFQTTYDDAGLAFAHDRVTFTV